MTSPRLWPTAFLAAVTLGVVPVAARAQRPTPPLPTLDGMECFHAALHAWGSSPNVPLGGRSGLPPLGPLPADQVFVQTNFSDVILVITGSSPLMFRYQNHRIDELISRVVGDGGAVLVATSCSSAPFVVNGRQVHRYMHELGHNRPVVPVTTRGPGRGAPGPDEAALFDGLRTVITPNPGTFSFDVPVDGLAPLASPPFSRRPFALGRSDGDKGGRLVLLADDGVLSNGQLLAGDGRDNFALCGRLVHYLRDPDGRNRTHCAVFENGRYVNPLNTLYKFEMPPLPPIKLPDLGPLQGKLVDAINKQIDRAQDENVLNQIVLGPTSDRAGQSRRLRELLEGVAVVAAVLATVWCLRRLWKARHTPEPTPPLTRGTPPKLGVIGVADRRQRELVQRNNLNEPVRFLVREFLATAGAPPAPTPKPPPVRVAVTGRPAADIRKAVGELWAVSHGRGGNVTVARWQELEPRLALLRSAFEHGDWRFDTPHPAANGGAAG